MSPETFDFLVYASIAVGLVWAAIRLYQDLTRPLPEEEFEERFLQDVDDTEDAEKRKKGEKNRA
jgi:hypothetical protein